MRAFPAILVVAALIVISACTTTKITQTKAFEDNAQASLEMFEVSAYGTNQSDCIREGFWLIVVTEGNEDETEIADTPDRCGQGDQGHPPGNAQAILGRRKDPHCP